MFFFYSHLIVIFMSIDINAKAYTESLISVVQIQKLYHTIKKSIAIPGA